MDSADIQSAILIVEDDPQIRELATFAARKAGFSRIVTASDGQAALESLTAMDPLVPYAVLTDLAMPRVDGHTLVYALRQNPATAEVPIFMFSSSGAAEDRHIALAAGCRAYFEKPTSLDALVDIMAEVRSAALHAAETRH